MLPDEQKCLYPIHLSVNRSTQKPPKPQNEESYIYKIHIKCPSEIHEECTRQTKMSVNSQKFTCIFFYEIQSSWTSLVNSGAPISA